MPLLLSSELAPLVLRAQRTLGLSQEKLGDMLGVARRTVIRWSSGSVPSRDQVVTLARAVHPKDPELASQLCVAAGTRLAEIGLGATTNPGPAVPLPELMVDSIVHAAASASAMTPQAARAGLLAALERAATLGMTSEDLRSALRERG